MFYRKKRKSIVNTIKLILIVILIFLVSRLAVVNLFPIKYEEIIDKYAKMYNLNKELVLAVINTESRFNKDAISNKGAVGLMQIMPETGQWLAEKLNIEDYSEDMLKEPDFNINLGCYYLSMLLEEFKDEKLALCAYNAGSSNVKKWLQDENYSLNGEIHTIPFEETDKYIKKIEISKIVYKILLKINA